MSPALAEERSLGRELARVYKRLVDGAMHLTGDSYQKAQREVEELLSATSLEDVLVKDVKEISWFDLYSLAEGREAYDAWELMKEAAREESELVITAAKRVEGDHAEP